MQAVSALCQLMSARFTRLGDILVAVEHHAGLARHGLTEAPAANLLFSLLPLFQARHNSGPVKLQRPNPDFVMLDVWRNYFKTLAGSKTPVSQVHSSVAAIHACQGKINADRCPRHLDNVRLQIRWASASAQWYRIQGTPEVCAGACNPDLIAACAVTGHDCSSLFACIWCLKRMELQAGRELDQVLKFRAAPVSGSPARGPQTPPQAAAARQKLAARQVHACK